MSKRKWRRGPRILSLDELVRQEFVFWWNKPTHSGWFMSWQLRMAAKTINRSDGILFYAMPANVECRFSDEEILRAEKRLGTEPTLEGRTALIQFLKEWDDTGRGDVDNLIDRYEDWEDR